MRNRMAAFVEKNPEKFLPFVTQSLDKEIRLIREMGNEAEGIACNYMGEVLGTQIKSVILDREQVSD